MAVVMICFCHTSEEMCIKVGPLPSFSSSPAALPFPGSPPALPPAPTQASPFLTCILHPRHFITMESTRTLPALSLSWIPHNIVLALVSLVMFYAVTRAIYQLVLSPLSAVPGPWYAALSDFWMTTHVLRLQQCKTNHRLFEEYGPVVRVGPNKVIFKDITSMRSVYSIHKFDKSAFYKSLLTFVALPIPSLKLTHPLLGTRTTMRKYSSP